MHLKKNPATKKLFLLQCNLGHNAERIEKSRSLCNAG